jgi:hypothetical protein
MAHNLKTQADVIALLKERGYDPDGFIRRLRLVVPTKAAASIRAVGPAVAADALWHLVNDLTCDEEGRAQIARHAQEEFADGCFGAGWHQRALADLVADGITGQMEAAS